jgi:hypothetical protein
MIGACCWRAWTEYLASAPVGAGVWAGHKAPQRSASGSPLPDCGHRLGQSLVELAGSPATLALSSRARAGARIPIATRMPGRTD